MPLTTMKFGFRAEFAGEFPTGVEDLENWAREFEMNPRKYVQNDWEMEGFEAAIQLSGQRYSITLNFTIVWTEDEDYLSDGSVIRDQVDIWEDELPREGLTVTVMNQTIAPLKVKWVEMR